MKQFSKILIILSAIVILGSGVVLAASSDLSCTSNTGAYPWCKATSSLGGSTGLVNTFYNISLALVGVAAFGVIVYGGILYTISAGNPSKQQDAVEWITGAVYGVILLFGAYFLLNTINPELVELREPIITEVEISTSTANATSTCCLYNETGIAPSTYYKSCSNSLTETQCQYGTFMSGYKCITEETSDQVHGCEVVQ